jgi:hypothetical protein
MTGKCPGTFSGSCRMPFKGPYGRWVHMETRSTMATGLNIYK